MRVHLIGIGGAGMSALAHLYLERGDQVSGSDEAGSEVIDALVEAGARVVRGHDPANLGDAEVVVRSTAIPEGNLELVGARARGTRVISRGRAAAEIASDYRQVVIAGTHGKTTTTTFVAGVLRPLSPLVLSGGRLPGSLFNSRPGRGQYAVIEGDESDGSFLELTPDIAVVTSVEADHLDRYRDLDEIRRAFARFAERTVSVLIGCADDPGACATVAAAPGEVLTYGFQASDVHAEEYLAHSAGSEFNLYTPWGDRQVRLVVPGMHNARNALAAATVGLRLGLEIDDVIAALSAARLPGRRLELVAEVNGGSVYDDYGHHPTEVTATLKAARELTAGRLICAFQPHRSSRLAALMHDFGRAFGEADEVLILPLYKAGEPDIPGVDSAALLHAIELYDPGVQVTLLDRLDQLEDELLTRIGPGDVAVCMGAGDINRVSAALVGRGYGRSYAAGT